jgi:hypothetical protein
MLVVHLVLLTSKIAPIINQVLYLKEDKTLYIEIPLST